MQKKVSPSFMRVTVSFLMLALVFLFIEEFTAFPAPIRIILLSAGGILAVIGLLMAVRMYRLRRR